MATSDRRPILLDFEKPLVDLELRIAQIRQLAQENEVDVSEQIAELESRALKLRQEIFSGLSPVQRLQVARHPRRPSTLDYVQAITDEWIELHGDRLGSDDRALVGGVASLAGQSVVILGHQKGRDTKDNVARNFGMASPGGYRKALRLMQHADRFRMPILSFIDTPGAYPGVEAERLGQGEAIARNLRDMFNLSVPIICTVIGEGGSGGALGIGVGDRLLMFEHSVYYVASPEACASILWKDASKAFQASEALKITASDLRELKIIDQVLPEPLGGAHTDPLRAAAVLKEALLTGLADLANFSPVELRQARYQKFRQIGQFYEAVVEGQVHATPDQSSSEPLRLS